MSEGKPQWSEKDGGAAFAYSVPKLFTGYEQGISQRGYYAGKALQGMMAKVEASVPAEYIAERCVAMADALMVELRK